MAENEYNVPFGIDATGFAKGLQAMRKDVQDIQAIVSKSTTLASEAFTAAGQASSKAMSDTTKAIKQTAVETDNLVKAAKPLQDSTSKALDSITKAAPSAKAQLRALTDELILLKTTNPTNPKIAELTEQAGNLKDEISDVQQGIALVGSDTSGIDATIQGVGALAGGFAVAQGASALFGSENKEVQQALLKVTAAMSILQGLQAIGQVLDKNSAVNQKLKLLFTAAETTETEALTVAKAEETVVTEELTVAQEGLNKALEANPAGALLLIVGIIATAVAALNFFSNSEADASEKAKIANDSLKEQNELLVKLAGFQTEAAKAATKKAENDVSLAVAQGASQNDIYRLTVTATKAAQDENALLIKNLNLTKEKLNATEEEVKQNTLLLKQLQDQSAELLKQGNSQVRDLVQQAISNKILEVKSKNDALQPILDAGKAAFDKVDDLKEKAAEDAAAHAKQLTEKRF